ncbi:hypothetical protein V8E36_002465 [Tilletia maclaganii]
MSSLLANAETGRGTGTGSSSSGGSSTSTAASNYTPARRTFAHASTFHAGMTTHTSGVMHTTPALGARIFDPTADIDQDTAQQRAELQKTARQVRLSVSRGYCVSTPPHTRANSFASTMTPSSEHPDIDGSSSTHSTVGELPFLGRSTLLPWSRTQSAPVANLGQPSTSPSASSSPPLSFKNDGDFRAKELQPYASGPQRPWEVTLSTQSGFGRHSSIQSQHRARPADVDQDDEGDITAISLEAPRPGKGEAGAFGALDSVLGAHFEADEADENGRNFDRADRQGSSSDEEELNGGNSSSQSEDEDELLSASALSMASAESGGSKTAGNSRKAANLDSSTSRPPLSSRPNGLASKTTSLPAGPFDAANRIDQAFARRTVLRQGLEGRTRTVAVVTPTLPSRRVADAATAENDIPPWTSRDFARWASSSDF